MSNDSSAFDTGPGRADSTAGETIFDLMERARDLSQQAVWRDENDDLAWEIFELSQKALDMEPDLLTQGMWRPIDAAPDNMAVLVFDSQIGVALAKSDGNNWWHLESGLSYVRNFRDDPHSIDPSHWMPLPPAPAAISQDDKAPERR